jgi:acyl-CoA thioesterase
MPKLSDNLSNNRPSGDRRLHTGPHTIDSKVWIDTAPFGRLLHMEIVKTDAGTAVLSMPFLSDFAQGSGFMHGGALVSLADTAAVMAIKSLVPEGTHFATVSLKTTFLYPVQSGVVIAKARVTARRKYWLYSRVRVFNQANRPVMDFRAGFKISSRRGLDDSGHPTAKNPKDPSG